jgi:DNA-directed RNA polymerase subunit RPC12/RpoP
MLQNHQIVKKLTKRTAQCLCARCGSTFVSNFYEACKSRVGHLCRDCKYKLIALTNPTQADLLEVFRYDPVSGSQVYLSVLVGGKQYLAHRLIWFMQTGQWPDQVDHLDHDRSNNRWTNLREILGPENQKNMGKVRKNSNGEMGVRVLPSGRFSAYIMVNRKQISLGTYDTLNNAIQARKAGQLRYGFHPNHGS